MRKGTDATFKDRLHALIGAAGITPYALAQRSGLSKQTLSQLLSGKSVPTWDTVQCLALALGVDYAAFADPTLTLPELGEPKKAGRPRKVEAPPAGPAPAEVPPPAEAPPAKKPRKKTGG